MIKFDDFVNENYTLTIEEDGDEVTWLTECNLSDIWTEYKSKKIDNNNFIKKYTDKLVSMKNELLKIGNDCWNDLVKIVKEKSTEPMPQLDKIYDWGDKYGVKIISN